MNAIDTSNIDRSALLKVIDYLEESERLSYEEYVLREFEDFLGEKYTNTQFTLTKKFYGNPNVNHIYAVARRLKDSISA
ncbi:MAG: hypothetical protein HOP21_04645 [Methylotenera sp.]|nr:hypothetical protein [Methylotenera sp.]